MRRIILMGAPGSGKGTQGDLLAQEWGIPRLAPGDIFRSAIKAGTELGRQVQAYSEAGLLVPDELVIEVMGERLKQAQEGWILDGFPRTIPQAQSLDSLLVSLNQKCDRIINLTVPAEVLLVRLKRRAVEQKRADDTEEVIQRRLQEYNEKTFPLLEFYGDRIVHIDGTMPVEAVTCAIKRALGI
jgi:adenylate kinase